MTSVTRSVALTATSDSPSPSSSRLATAGTGKRVVGSSAARSRTPTVSVSPPPSLHSPAPQLRLPPQQGTPPPRESRAESIAGSLTNGLGNVHLSSPAPETPGGLDMSAVAAAVESVERGTDEQAPLPETPPATPGALRPPRSTPATQPRTRSPRARSPRTRSSSQLAPYNIEDEKLPRHRLYDPDVQHALHDSKALMASLADALGSSRSRLHADRGSTIRSLYKQATALANFQFPPSWTVGFVGGTGAGKSSLINSLLDHTNLAKEGGSDGKASTCVATEFRYRAGDNFAIEVELFSEDKLQEQLANLVRSYRNYHLPEEATRAETADAANANEAAIARIGSKEDAKRALSMLRTLFGTQIDTSEQRLLADSEESLLSALGRQLLNNRAALSSQQEVFASVGACSERLEELTVEPREDAPGEPVSWPYIRTIKVFLNAPILSKGLILVDLPGLGDRNTAREAVTERYLMQCNEIFAVYSIIRAVDDAGVEHVVSLGRQARLSNVGVVCTRSEEFGSERIENTRGPKAEMIQELAREITNLKQEVEELNLALRYAYEDDNENDSSGDEVDKPALQRSIWQKEDELKNSSFNLLRLRIEDRNENVEKGIKETYKDKIPGGIQQVFCVGNKQYWEFRDRPKAEFLPWLHLSGILQLRMHCLSKVADSQLVLATKHVQESIPALLSAVELWVASGAGGRDAEEKKAIRETLDRVEHDLITKLRGRRHLTAGVSTSIKETFDTEIYSNCNPIKWTNGALAAGQIWESWAPGTYMAFCRNFGEHKTRSKDWRSWNEEAMKSMVDDLNGPWDKLCSILKKEHRKKITQIKQFVDNKMHELGTVAPSALLRTMKSRNAIFVSEIRNCVNRFDSALSTLRRRALSGIRTSLFAEAMEETYIKAMNKNGSGCTKIKIGIMNAGLGDRALFENIVRDIRREFSQLAQVLQAKMVVAALEYLEAIRVTFDMIRKETVLLESELDWHFTNRVSVTVAAEKVELERLQNVLV